jgi:multifunctional methyltransferase subunit TRM112
VLTPLFTYINSLENCTKDNFPLVFENVELEIRPAEANLDFIKRFIPKLEWNALVQTARSIGQGDLPDKLPEDKETLEDEEFLKKLHHVLMEVRRTASIHTPLKLTSVRDGYDWMIPGSR